MDEYYILYFFIGLGIIGVLGKLIKKEKFTLDNESYFHRIYTLGYFSFFFLLLLNTNEYQYHSASAKLTREIERLPILNKNMHLLRRTKNTEEWVNEGKLRHFKKIKIGKFRIIKETDYFVNNDEMKTLIIEYISSNLFLEESKKYFINDTIGWSEEIYNRKKLITVKKSDSILIKWHYNLDSIYYKK